MPNPGEESLTGLRIIIAIFAVLVAVCILAPLSVGVIRDYASAFNDNPRAGNPNATDIPPSGAFVVVYARSEIPNNFRVSTSRLDVAAAEKFYGSCEEFLAAVDADYNRAIRTRAAALVTGLNKQETSGYLWTDQESTCPDQLEFDSLIQARSQSRAPVMAAIAETVLEVLPRQLPTGQIVFDSAGVNFTIGATRPVDIGPNGLKESPTFTFAANPPAEADASAQTWIDFTTIRLDLGPERESRVLTQAPAGVRHTTGDDPLWLDRDFYPGHTALSDGWTWGPFEADIVSGMIDEPEDSKPFAFFADRLPATAAVTLPLPVLFDGPVVLTHRDMSPADATGS